MQDRALMHCLQYGSGGFKQERPYILGSIDRLYSNVEREIKMKNMATIININMKNMIIIISDTECRRRGRRATEE